MNFAALLFVLLAIILVLGYVLRRDRSQVEASETKQLQNDSDSDDVTESEPELEIKDRQVEKMEQIAEECNDPKISVGVGVDEKDAAGDESSDSDEYSMQRMVEEYHQSRTLPKIISEVVEEWTDAFRQRSMQLRRKLVPPKEEEAVIRPMHVPSSQRQDRTQKSRDRPLKANNMDNAGNNNNDEEAQMLRDKVSDFEVDFDTELDEKQAAVEVESVAKAGNVEVIASNAESMDSNVAVDSADDFADFNMHKSAAFEMDNGSDMDASDAVEKEQEQEEEQEKEKEEVSAFVKDEALNMDIRPTAQKNSVDDAPMDDEKVKEHEKNQKILTSLTTVDH